MRSFVEGRLIRLVIVAGIAISLGQPAMAATCDRACLLQYAEIFNRDILAHTPDKLPLAPSAQIRENTKTIALDASRWTTVKQIRSRGVYADPVLGNAIEHVAAEEDGGKIVYIGTRLKVADGKITEVEINFDDGPRVNPKNIIPYDPIFNTIVPVEDRSSRAQLESIITRYLLKTAISRSRWEGGGRRGAAAFRFCMGSGSDRPESGSHRIYKPVGRIYDKDATNFCQTG